MNAKRMRLLTMAGFCFFSLRLYSQAPAPADKHTILRTLTDSLVINGNDSELMTSIFKTEDRYGKMLIKRGYDDSKHQYQFLGPSYFALLMGIYFRANAFLNDNYDLPKPRTEGRKDQLSILYYHFSDDTLKIWLIGNSGVVANTSERLREDQIGLGLQRLRKAIGVVKDLPSRGIEAEVKAEGARLDTCIHELTSVLLPKPIKSHLDSVNHQHLIVLGENVISQIPFYLLKPFHNSYMIDNFTISIAPALMDSRRIADFFHSGFVSENLKFTFVKPVVVGNPRYSPKLKFKPLPGAESEAIYVGDLLKVDPLIGVNATLSQVLSKIDSCDFLYLATHAYNDQDNPMDSFIALTPDSQDKDGKWSAREIMNTKIAAQLAIVSACETGVGQMHEGGTIGLPTSFYLAGVRHSILSYWPVEDTATRNLMGIFLNQLQQTDFGFPSTHLRRSILEYRQKDPNPRNWAAFMMFGYPY